MKSRPVFLMCSLVLLSIIITGVSYAETLCFDVIGFCNDMRIRTDTIGTKTTGDFRIWGHEYGCGKNDREVFGSLRVKNGIWYVGFTEIAGSGGPDTGAMFTYISTVTYNPKTGNGTYKMGYVDFGGYVGSNSGTIKKVMCPSNSAAPLAADAPDLFDSQDNE